MNNEDFKLIVYYLGYRTLGAERILMTELGNELVEKGYIKTRSDISNYGKEKLDLYVKEVSFYSNLEFNNFINNLLSYIKLEFDKENYFYLSYQVMRYFIVFSDFHIKFKSDSLIKIFLDFQNEVILESQTDIKDFVFGGVELIIKDMNNN